ncbi:uncharacterized protein LOC123563181 [Mercenaria mercenaria]|uniref:uncharacterized protein LOC123563181 n=1 Tax=Mercenaria mercenaria TaxID=6596 RepID=UPI00234EDDD2|nr:uncharacterized protein LOC123563181 [Mercenaria mercenaria]
MGEKSDTSMAGVSPNFGNPKLKDKRARVAERFVPFRSSRINSVQNAIDSLAYQPWTCYDIRRLDNVDEGKDEYDHFFMRALTTARRLFPSNRPCGKFLAEKVVTGGKSALQLDSMDAMKRLHFLSACLPAKVLKKAIDDIGCSFGSELMKDGALTGRLTKYLAKKCAAPPQNVDEVTCTSLETNYKPYLKSMKRSFFKSLPQAVMCDTKCLDLFKGAEGFPKDVMKFIMKQCYKDSSTISPDDVKNLGGLVTDLPLDKFDQINAADLETNIKSIKNDLKAAKKQRGKKAVVKKLAKKMLDDGKVSDLVDSKEIMKEVSLKDLKASLSQSADVIQDLGIGDTNATLGFTDSQKKWVVKQVVKNKQAGAFTVEDLREMKSLVTGLLSSHIKKMGEAHSNDAEGMELAREMCTHTDWPRKSLEAINKYLIQSGLNVRNSTDPMSSLTVMDVEGLGCQCLLNFNTSEYEYMDQEVCSAVCMKIGYCDIFRCLNPTRRKNVLQACLKCKGLGSHMITDTDFDELGPNLISQMSRAQLDLVPAEVLQSHVEFFKDICMDQTLRTAVSEALQEVIGSSGTNYEPETLYLLGSAIKVLPKALQAQLDKTVIADMQTALMEELVPDTDEEINLRKCCEKWLNTTDLDNLKEQNFNLMLTVKDAFFADSELLRKKRSNLFPWTCRQIRPLPVLFATASAKEIDAMNNQEFVDCLEVIGNIQTLKRWQRELLLTKARTALSKQNVCDMTVSELEQLGVIALGFSVQDISCLPLSNENLVSSLGGLEGWNTQQLSALATRYMSTNSLSNLSTLTSSNITMLGPIICGFTASQISTLSPAEFGNNGEDIGSMTECGLQQWKAFVSLAVQDNAYGPISTWEAEDVNELKFIIAGLSGSEIKELTEAALEGLDADVIPLIPRDVLKNKELAQLQSLSDVQASAVTNSQRAVLTAEQNAVLDRIVDSEPVIGAGHSGTNSTPVLGKVFGSVMIMVAMTIQSIVLI